MSADILKAVTAADVAAPRQRRWRGFLAIPQGGLGVALLVLLLALVIAGPFIAPDGPNEISDQPLLGSSADHWLGTDTYGRDILSRMLHGGASVILLPLLAVSLAMVVATIVGLLSGYLGGKVNTAVSWVINIALAVPSYLAVLVVVAAFGGGGAVVVTAVAVIYAPYITRVIHSATQAIAPREFVLAARARGESLGWILFREITPNIGPTLMVEVALRFTYAIGFIASLSFLGLGVQPPSSNWGVMVAENRALLLIHPIGVLAPAMLIGALAIAVNLIADALTQFFGDRIHERLMV